MPVAVNAAGQARRAALWIGGSCFAAYAACYIGRNVFSALLPQLLQEQTFAQEELGRMGSVFLLAYGVGQLVNGVLGNRVFAKLEELSKPTIAAVNGFALGGGCELAMACDIRLASEKAKFGQPETGLGITPGFGGTQRLPRSVGAARAMELILTAKNISADRAREIGLVSEVYPPEELMDRALELANAIAANAQVAVRQSKAAIRRGQQTDMYTGAAYEAEAFAVCFATEDQKDAMTAFVNKEKVASFKNR